MHDLSRLPLVCLGRAAPLGRCLRLGDGLRFPVDLREVDALFRLVHLALAGCGLDQLPEDVWELRELECLMVTHNNIREISADIKCMRSLKRLLIGWNKIGEIPKEVWSMVYFEYFAASNLLS